MTGRRAETLTLSTEHLTLPLTVPNVPEEIFSAHLGMEDLTNVREELRRVLPKVSQ